MIKDKTEEREAGESVSIWYCEEAGGEEEDDDDDGKGAAQLALEG